VNLHYYYYYYYYAVDDACIVADLIGNGNQDIQLLFISSLAILAKLPVNCSANQSLQQFTAYALQLC